MSGIKKEKWTESEVLALPAGEHDNFDRKSGALLTDKDFRKDVAKALSAFANSGGGHLILGVKDDGSFDGVPLIFKGRTPTREWLEQIIPGMLSYPLEDFRVHEVVPDNPTAIPNGMVIIVVDVGDSALAPHQAADAKTYYYREGGHSKPAPHFYLETLRNRLVNPSLTAVLTDVQFVTAYHHNQGVFVEMKFLFRITNNSRVAAYKWGLSIDEMTNVATGRERDYLFAFQKFPHGSRGRSSSIRIDTTILPSLFMDEERDFGVFLHPSTLDGPGILADLSTLLHTDFGLTFRAISETSRGEPQSVKLATVMDLSGIATSAANAISEMQVAAPS
ncbi:MAG: ATP-binding protein [Planctomycetes bacterium]|nr:ATP-binding protein [Planctomycetota bacterium]